MFRRTLDDIKSVAKTFIEFLEENDLKHEMPRTDLKSVFESKYRLKYCTPGVSFSSVLNTLKYHLRQCQEIHGRVIFGSGEAAALRMLSIEDLEESSSDEEEENYSRNPRCKICRRRFQDIAALENHLETVSHRQQSVLKKIRESVEKPALVLDKNGIMVTSMPQADENGVIELNVGKGEGGRITLVVENTGTEEVELKDITLLWKVNFFIYSDISSVGPDRGNLYAGKRSTFSIGCKNRREYGYSYVPVVLTFELKNGSEFHILRFLAVQIVSDLFEELRPTSRYRTPSKAQKVPWDVKTTRGLALPPLRRDGLRMEKLERYEVPPTVIAQHDRRGIREQLEKPLTFDSYKDRFRLLLQLEEIQMKKDIRHYDLKEVEMEEDRTDRRFLILEVPGLAENRPSVLRGDRIYAYEHGLRQHRYEGIVHKVQLLNVKLGFDRSKIPFIKGKKFDIQFTFNRLTVQMEHRACERIASERRKEMRQVLFPQQESLVRRAEINKRVDDRSFYDRNLNDEQKQARKNFAAKRLADRAIS